MFYGRVSDVVEEIGLQKDAILRRTLLRNYYVIITSLFQ